MGISSKRVRVKTRIRAYWQRYFSTAQYSYTTASLVSALLLLASIFLGNVVIAPAAYAEAIDNDLEYRIKAAYLYNLSKFIIWPNEAKDSTEPIHVCLFDNNPFKDYIFKLEQRKARGRPLKIIEKPSTEQLAECDIMFVPINAAAVQPMLVEAIKTKHVLTVGETEEFLEQGGLITLNLENDRVQLTIANDRAKQQGFEISANLLEVARQVK
jgi:hypothetical protein